MTTPKKLIEILREDFNCSLRTEKIISHINMIETRLSAQGYIESAKVFTPDNMESEALSLKSENADVYIFYIISKEALIHDDIDRLNNFSTLYAKALGEIGAKKSAAGSFKNIW